MVKKGDFLAQIDPRPYQLLQAQFEGQLAHDQGVLAQSQIDLTRYQKLAEQNSIARQQYEDQVYIVQQNQGTVKLDQAQIDQQKLNVIYCRIVSPVTGRIGLRLVDPGNYVQTSTTTGIAVVTQLDPISVIFTVPEDEVPRIVSQFNSNANLVATAFDRANATELATGHLGSFDTEVDTTTGTVKMRALFTNGASRLFPFQFVNIRLVLDTLHGVVTVPAAAVQHGAPGDFVYVVNSESAAQVRKVTLGAQDGDVLAVSSGLTAGERVVIDGIDQLRDGSHVTVRDETAPTHTTNPDQPHRHNRRQQQQGSGTGTPPT